LPVTVFAAVLAELAELLADAVLLAVGLLVVAEALLLGVGLALAEGTEVASADVL
jgi:hypothetical protein